MTERHATLADGHLAYEDTGSGPTVVLLHGGALDRRMWDPQRTALSDRRVLAIDARGHGASSTPATPFRACDDVVAVLDDADVDRAVLVGLSLGAGTAVETAVEHPDRVTGLVVSGAGGGSPDFRDPWVLAILRRWADARAQGDPDSWLAAFMDFVNGPERSLAEVDPEVVAHVEAMARETLTRHVVDHLARGGDLVAPTPVEVAGRRTRIGVPVLAVHGGGDAHDHLRLARELVAEVPDGRELVVPIAGHYPNLEDPRRFNAALSDHLVRIHGR